MWRKAFSLANLILKKNCITLNIVVTLCGFYGFGSKFKAKNRGGAKSLFSSANVEIKA